MNIRLALVVKAYRCLRTVFGTSKSGVLRPSGVLQDDLATCQQDPNDKTPTSGSTLLETG